MNRSHHLHSDMASIANIVPHLIPVLVVLFSLLNATKADLSVLRNPSQPSKHFVLVHGACHGAWSWYKILSLLRSAGHDATARDMATSGINPVQIEDVQDSVSDYFQPLRDFMTAVPPDQRVILVGHSYGGLGIAQAMELFPDKIAVAVFVAAAMIGPQFNVSTLGQKAPKWSGSFTDSYYIYGHGPSKPPTAFAFGPKDLAAKLYQRSPSEDLAVATTLVRPLYLYDEEGLEKELVLSNEKYGSVSRVFIMSDNEEEKEYQEWMVKKNPPNEVYQIEGSDHMVMMSKPVELLFCLLDIAERYS